MTWISIAHESDCPPGKSVELVADGRIIALFNVDGVYSALDGICPHQGGPLGKGQLNGCIVTCPWHGWQFAVTSGQSQLSASVRQPCIPVKNDGGEIFVNLEPSD